MRDVVFRMLVDCPGHLEALADDLSLRIQAPSLEELQHEARDALIQHLGDAHGAYRVKLRQGRAARVPLRTNRAPGQLC